LPRREVRNRKALVCKQSWPIEHRIEATDLALGTFTLL
jgi:hypothetical protein